MALHRTTIKRGFSLPFYIFLTVIFLSAFQPRRVKAETFTPPPTNYVHKIWQTEDGLPNPMVRSVIQSHDGYLWLATDEGLAKFDGVRFTEIERKLPTEKPLRWFVGLTETKDGTIWASSVKGGVLRIQKNEVKHLGAADGLLNDFVLKIFQDSTGSIWFGSDGGLSELTAGKFLRHTNDPGLIVEAVRDIAEDRKGNLWIGTAKGLSCLQNGKFTSYTTNDLLINNAVYCLHEDRKGALWIGTGGGLTQVVDGKPRHYTEQEGVAHRVIRSILEDAEGTLWIGTQNGLQKFVNGRFVTVSLRNPMDPDFEGISFVYSICEDLERNLWVGSNLGLNRLRKQNSVTYTKDEGLPHNIATCVFEDSKGNLWIGTYGGGLCRIRGGEITTFTTENGLKSNHVLSICEDGEGAIWIGTDGVGLQRWMDNFFSSYSASDPKANIIRAIYSDHKTNLWLGANAGPMKLIDGQFVSQKGLSGGTVKAIVEDPKGRIWFAGDTALVHLGQTWTRAYTAKDGFTPESANAVYADRQDIYWIGTDTGLFCFRDKRFSNFGAIPELSQQRILHIIEDDLGNLWFSSRSGVFVVRREDLLAHLRGVLPTVSVVSFGQKEGMRRAQCNGIGQPAGWKMKDGRILFPTMHGVIVFDPKTLVRNQLPPNVVIEQITVDGKGIPAGADLKLRPNNGLIEFRYTALSLQVPEKVRFKYKLEGIDADWVDAGTRRVATYNNLPPGDYRFKVIACNNDGVWNESRAVISFFSTSHFYQTYWFYGLCVMGAIGSIASINLVRVRQLKTREKELMKLVEVHTRKFRKAIDNMESFNYSIAHDLRAPLRAIKGFTEALLEDYSSSFDAEGIEYSKRIEGAVDRMDHLISDLLTFGRITHKEVTFGSVKLESLLAQVLLELRDEIINRNAVVEIEKPMPEVWANETLLQQVLMNLVSNALKFVAKDRVPKIQIRAEQRLNTVKVFVQDNGIGIDPNHHERIFGVFERLHTNEYSGTGIGLAIVQKAVEQMDGNVGLTSRLGEGSCFWIELPRSGLPKKEDRANSDTTFLKRNKAPGVERQ